MFVKKSFSVLILTHNEERNLYDCVNSVSSSNDIVVLDSFSSDRTREIAHQLKVRFFQNEFKDFSSQRNYGLHQIHYKNDFVLILDADERATPELNQELLKICEGPQEFLKDVYFVRRRFIFEGKVLKWNYAATMWIERFLRPTKVSYIGIVHEKLEYEGDNGFLSNYLLHNPFTKGLNHCIERRKQYALLEATYNFNLKRWDSSSTNVILRRVRRKKFLVEYIPFYYVGYFFYNLIFHLSFLDGVKGLKYIGFESYSYYLVSKYRRNVKKHKQAKVLTVTN